MIFKGHFWQKGLCLGWPEGAREIVRVSLQSKALYISVIQLISVKIKPVIALVYRHQNAPKLINSSERAKNSQVAAPTGLFLG